MIHYSCATRASSFLTCLRVALISIRPFRNIQNVSTQSKSDTPVLPNNPFCFDSILRRREETFAPFNVTWKISCCQLKVFRCNPKVENCVTWLIKETLNEGEGRQFSTPTELAEVTFKGGLHMRKTEWRSSLPKRISQATVNIEAIPSVPKAVWIKKKKISFSWEVC